MIYLLLCVGLGLLLVCGDALVRGAVGLSVRLGIPTLVIGLTIVAFGTSAPELVVSLRAALSGAPGLALGNVVGSNIANVLLVLGLPAMLVATATGQPFVVRNTIYVILASLLFIALCWMGPLVFWKGALLFGLLVLFLFEQARQAEKHHDMALVLGDEAMELIEEGEERGQSNGTILMWLAIGLIGLPLAATLTVYSATRIAQMFNVSNEVIGLTVVALGTSLPELVTTMAAALRGQAALAIGSVLGSNLFNLLAVMGVTSMVSTVPVPDMMKHTDLWIMLAASLLLLPFVLKGREISRWSGLGFMVAYLGYIYFSYSPHLSGGAAAHGLEAAMPMMR